MLDFQQQQQQQQQHREQREQSEKQQHQQNLQLEHTANEAQQDQFQFEFRGAVALNNMAVAMIKRSCYTQACQTFRDAVSAITCLAASANRDDDNDNNNKGIDESKHAAVQNSLTAAFQRSSRPHPCNNVPSSVQPTVISHSDSISFLSKPSRKKELYFIQIDTTDVDILDSSNNNSELLDPNGLPAIILLYNYGVAHLLRAAMVSNNRLRARKHRRAGLELLLLCHQVLTPLFDEQCQTANDLSFLSKCGMLLAQTLEGLSYGFETNGQETEVRECLCHLACMKALQKEFQSLYETIEAVVQTCSVAAAA